MNELVSIVMPAHNSEHTINQVLDSILQQTYNNIELIIVNNGSIDGTGRIISEYRPKLLARRYTLKYIEVPHPLGHAPAINVGLKQASGKYILILHSDIALGTRDWIEHMVNELNHDDRIAVASSLLITKPEELNFINRIFAYIYILGWHDLVKMPKAYVNYTGLSNDLIRARIFNEIGALDETYKYGMHDVLFSEAVRRRGYLILLDTEVYAKHLLSSDQNTLKGHLRKLWQYGFPSAIVLMRYHYLPDIDNLLFILSIIFSLMYFIFGHILIYASTMALMLFLAFPFEPINFYGKNRYAVRALKTLANLAASIVGYLINPLLLPLGLGSGVILYRALASSAASWRRFRDIRLSSLVFLFFILSSLINGVAVMAGLIYWPLKQLSLRISKFK